MIPISRTTPASDVTSPNCRKAPSRAVSRLPVAMTANPATTAPVSPSRRPAADPAPSPVPPLDTEGSQKSETCRPGEPGYAREATFREPRRAPAASSAGQPRSSVSLPCAVAQSPAWTAFRPPPVCCARRGRPAGLDHQPAGRQDPGRPRVRSPAYARRSGPSRLRCLRPGPDGAVSVTAVGGSPVTSEGSWPFGWFGTSRWVSDGGAGGGIEFARPA